MAMLASAAILLGKAKLHGIAVPIVPIGITPVVVMPKLVPEEV